MKGRGSARWPPSKIGPRACRLAWPRTPAATSAGTLAIWPFRSWMLVSPCACRTRAPRIKPSNRSTRAERGWRVAGRESRACRHKGNPKEAVWLPNEAVAKAWMEYVKTGAVGDTTPAAGPNQRARCRPRRQGRGDFQDAEADLKAASAAFIVLRDGEELAQVPPKPVGKFGRPLFQSMTYHDTPSKPLPEMRHTWTPQ